MRSIKISLWAVLVLALLLWLVSNPLTPLPTGLFGWRGQMVQLTGVLGIVAMSVAMLLALRPRWPEPWLGGLDKMYRLHKWLGIAALTVGVAHFLWAKGPKWAVGLGLLERPARGPRPPVDNAVEQVFSQWRGFAEGIGEWAFYAAVLLIVLALVKRFPYRPFLKTHRLLALAYLVLVFHAVVLVKFTTWTQPQGLLLAPLLAAGTYAAVVVLLRRVGVDRKVAGSIAALRYYPGVRALQVDVDVPAGWPGHRPGQFAFAVSDPAEGAHPYTIASAWDDRSRRITFVVKELGDHTRRLREKLTPGQAVTVEGPYGCFTFDDDRPLQIWVGGGIGITPFIARMRDLAARPSAAGQRVHLFHTTAELDEGALEQLRADARAAAIDLTILVDARDGINAADQAIADMLRKLGKPVVLVVNKIDGIDSNTVTHDFYSLALGEPVPIAASHGRNVHELLARIDALIPPLETDLEEEDPGIAIAIVGRPNVGKSTLVNRLLGEERVVVFDEAGTTRDSIYIPFERNGQKFTLIDTAGMRRRSRVSLTVEKFSIIKSLQAIEKAHVVIYLIDAREGVTDQDAHILGLVLEAGRALIIGLNKWDGLSAEHRDFVKKQIEMKLSFLDFAEKHPISALHGSGVDKCSTSFHSLYDSAMIDMSTPVLTRILSNAIAAHQPPLVGGRRIKLKYAHRGGAIRRSW